MDLLKHTTQRKNGCTTAVKYYRSMQYEFRKRMFSQLEFDMYEIGFPVQAIDYSLLGNRLLMADKDSKVSLYDIAESISSGYDTLQLDKSDTRVLDSGLECINWNSEGFFTLSTNGKHLFCIDHEKMLEIDRIIFNETFVVQHKPNPHKNSLIAVATWLSGVLLVDLKSGNTSHPSSYDPEGVMAVSWCELSENLLTTAADDGTCFWDIRRFNRPMFQNQDNCSINSIWPNIEVIPNTDKVMILNVDKSITLWDVHKQRKCKHFGPFETSFSKDLRYKFALGGPGEPSLLFMPADNDIRIYDFATMETIGELHGHTSPVGVLFFNNTRDQLYSSSAEKNLAWTPKPLCSPRKKELIDN